MRVNYCALCCASTILRCEAGDAKTARDVLKTASLDLVVDVAEWRRYRANEDPLRPTRSDLAP